MSIVIASYLLTSLTGAFLGVILLYNVNKKEELWKIGVYVGAGGSGLTSFGFLLSGYFIQCWLFFGISILTMTGMLAIYYYNQLPKGTTQTEQLAYVRQQFYIIRNFGVTLLAIFSVALTMALVRHEADKATLTDEFSQNLVGIYREINKLQQGQQQIREQLYNLPKPATPTATTLLIGVPVLSTGKPQQKATLAKPTTKRIKPDTLSRKQPSWTLRLWRKLRPW